MTVNNSYNFSSIYSGNQTIKTVDTKEEFNLNLKAVMPNKYSQYFPTRGGEATKLGYSVENPSYESFSSGKSFDEVAADARIEMNAQYKKMKDSGTAFSANSSEGKDYNELFQNFDRRALYAVSSNEGGKFSKQEQDMASSIMGQQLGLSSGFYSGPSRLAGTYTNVFGDNYAAQADSMLSFLDKVSPEEKSSGKWMLEVVGAENLKNANSTQENKPKEDEFSLLKMLLNADKELVEKLRQKSVQKRQNLYTAQEEKQSFSISA
jgi:hypothetical protein